MSMKGLKKGKAHGTCHAISWLAAMLLTFLLSCADEPYEGTPDDVPRTNLPFVCLSTPDGTDITRNSTEGVTVEMTLESVPLPLPATPAARGAWATRVPEVLKFLMRAPLM